MLCRHEMSPVVRDAAALDDEELHCIGIVSKPSFLVLGLGVGGKSQSHCPLSSNQSCSDGTTFSRSMIVVGSFFETYSVHSSSRLQASIVHTLYDMSSDGLQMWKGKDDARRFEHEVPNDINSSHIPPAQG